MKSLKYALAGLAFAAALPAAAADTITIKDAFARFMPGGRAGAAFMTIENAGAEDDRLVGVASDAAERVELHTHKMGADGSMQMLHVPEGFAIPAGGAHELKRGGDHVMFMGPTDAARNAASVTVTLTFEKAGEVTIDIPVDNQK